MTAGIGPVADDVLPATRAYLAKDGNSAGGSLHLVLDDRNVEDEHVQFCIEYATKEGDGDAILLGAVLMKLSVVERERLIDLVNSDDSSALREPRETPET